MIEKLNAANFLNVIENPKKPVLVDFWAEWCGPCKMMSGRIKELEEEMKDKAIVCKVNVDDEGMLSDSYNIQSVPTFLIFKNGQMMEEFVGMASKEQLKKTLEKYINSSSSAENNSMPN